jgi:hypothetical protein
MTINLHPGRGALITTITLGLLAATTIARADVITFPAVATDELVASLAYDAGPGGEFTFYSQTADDPLYLLAPTDPDNIAGPAASTLANYLTGDDISIEKTDLSTFDLQSAFLGIDGSVAPQTIEALGYKIGVGVFSQTFTIDGPTTVVLDLNNISDIGFFPLGGQGGVELGGFNTAASSPGVPEPSAWTMILIGFAGMGAALRRRGRFALS